MPRAVTLEQLELLGWSNVPGLRRDSPGGRRYRLLDMPGLGERQAAIVAGVAVGRGWVRWL